MVVASEYMTAVLENAGYLAQAHLLDEFAPLFSSLGSLIFIIAGIGGMISIAIFGSFRAARYLLVGPILFWTLIGPRTDVEGVVWKLGGGEVRSFNGVPSDESVRQVTETPSGPINISAIFQFYTTSVSSIANTLVDAILKLENSDDLFFIHRTRAMEMMFESHVSDSRLLQMFKNGMFANDDDPSQESACANLMNAAYTASAPAQKGKELAQFETDFAAWSADGKVDSAAAQDLLAQASKLEGAKAQYKELWERVAKQSYVRPNEATKGFIQDNFSRPEVQTVLSNNKITGGSYEEVAPQLNKISCTDMWSLLTLGIYDHAKTSTDEILQQFNKEWNNDEETNKQFCRSLARKMGTDVPVTGEGECDLVPYMFMYMIRNITAASSLSERAQSLKDRMMFLQLAPEDKVITTGDKNAADWQVVESFGVRQEERNNITGHITVPTQMFRRQGYDGECNDEAVTRDNCRWMTFTTLTEGDSQWQAIRAIQNYDTVGLRTKIFSFARELPYWQGTLLYILAVIYPMWAFVVLVPGRAESFLLFPLLWLWLKSWDVGFALATIFEKVLWNLMPNVGVPIKDQFFNDVQNSALPDLMAEAMKVDPFYHVHTYYWILSLVVLSIPTVTGSAILKAKKSILSSFTEGMAGSAGAQTMAQEGQSTAGAAWGMQVMNMKKQALNDIGGAATLSAGGRGEGMFEGGRMGDALKWGGAAAASALLRESPNAIGGTLGITPEKDTDAARQKAVNQRISKGIKGGTSVARKIIDNGARTANDILGEVVNLTGTYRSVYDPRLGRYGEAQIMADAHSAGMDPGGGHEINNSTKTVQSALVSTNTKTFKATWQIKEDLAFAAFNTAKQVGGAFDKSGRATREATRNRGVFVPQNVLRDDVGRLSVNGAVGLLAGVDAINNTGVEPGYGYTPGESNEIAVSDRAMALRRQNTIGQKFDYDSAYAEALRFNFNPSEISPEALAVLEQFGGIERFYKRVSEMNKEEKENFFREEVRPYIDAQFSGLKDGLAGALKPSAILDSSMSMASSMSPVSNPFAPQSSGAVGSTLDDMLASRFGSTASQTFDSVASTVSSTLVAGLEKSTTGRGQNGGGKND
jgi:hypothetical protein